jgi:hypothetical protein
LIKSENINLASRNSQYLNARDIAEKAEIAENVKQLGKYIQIIIFIYLIINISLQ